LAWRRGNRFIFNTGTPPQDRKSRSLRGGEYKKELPTRKGLCCTKKSVSKERGGENLKPSPHMPGGGSILLHMGKRHTATGCKGGRSQGETPRGKKNSGDRDRNGKPSWPPRGISYIPSLAKGEIVQRKRRPGGSDTSLGERNYFF